MKKTDRSGRLERGLSALLTFIFAVIPFIIGLMSYIPYYLEKTNEKYPILSAIYSSLKLYAGVTEGSIAMTLQLHIARFIALYFSLSIILKILDRSKRFFRRIKAGFKGNYVVCGDSVHAAMLCGDIGRLRCVWSEDEFIGGGRNYIIMFDTDSENLEFYARHYNELKNCNVYLRLEEIKRQNISNLSIRDFSISECCARLYWRKYYPERSERIAIVGFGSIGQNILTFGLQMNIISPSQHFEYYIWGDSSEFEKLHTGTDKMSPDSVIFRGSDWEADRDMISRCDRIIICSEKTDNVGILNKIMFGCSVSKSQIYIYSPNEDIVRSVCGRENIFCFGQSEEVATIDMIIHQKTMEDAVKLHNFYTMKYGGKPWNELNSFMRYSNISSADFLYVIKRLYEKGVSIGELAELEHIRWCRYYYLNNWEYSAVRNDEMRVHNCLLPFDSLSEAEKLKDIESVKVKLDIDQ